MLDTAFVDMADSGPRSEKKEQKRLPITISNLLDMAVYSFGSMKGLRDDHHVQSIEVVDGVCLMFGNLVENAEKGKIWRLEAQTTTNKGTFCLCTISTKKMEAEERLQQNK